MSVTAKVLIIIAVAAGVGIGAWLSIDRSATPGPAPEPPILDDPASVDPAVAKLLTETTDKVKHSPGDAALRAQLAMIYDANGLPSLAQKAYEQAIALDDDNEKWWYHLARARADRADLAGAVTAVEQAIKLDDEHGPAHWRRGFWLLDLGRIDQAQEAFQQADQTDPANPAAQVGLARVALNRKQYAEAAEMISLAIAGNKNPANLPYLKQLLGSAQRHLGQGGAMRVALSQAQGLGPAWPDAWHEEVLTFRTGYRAIIESADKLTAAGRADEAIIQLQQLLQRHPDDANALNYLADAHFARQQWDQGVSALQKALAANPAHFPSHLKLSSLYEAKGDLPTAMQHARQATQLNPGLGAAHLQVGRILMLGNQHAQAVEPLTTALKTGVSDPNVRIMLGRVHLKLSNWQEAARLFNQASHAAPQLAGAYAGLAHAKAELGAFNEAQMNLQLAQRINPNEPNLDRLAARLRQLQAASTPTSQP